MMKVRTEIIIIFLFHQNKNSIYIYLFLALVNGQENKMKVRWIRLSGT
jgi:hypothetical protein